MSTGLGMPSIQVLFKQLVASIIARSKKGRVVLVVKDDTEEGNVIAKYGQAQDVVVAAYTEGNYALIQQAFKGLPLSVTVVKKKTTETFTEHIAPLLGGLAYDWIAMLDATKTEQNALVTFVKSENARKKFKQKALVWDATAPNDMHVANLTTKTYKDYGGTSRDAWELLGRLVGIFAGLPFTRSATYYELPEISSVSEPADLDAAVNNGELILFNDDEGVRIGRAVNSMTTVGVDQTEDMKSIAFVEAMDIIRKDIYTAFKSYIGLYKNKYDYQALFIAAVLGYFGALAEEDILDGNYRNTADVDVDAQRRAWVASGKAEAAEWDDITVKLNTFKRQVFLRGNIKILDAMEDLTFTIDLV